MPMPMVMMAMVVVMMVVAVAMVPSLCQQIGGGSDQGNRGDQGNEDCFFHGWVMGLEKGHPNGIRTRATSVKGR